MVLTYVFATLFGLTVGVLLGHAVAQAPTMPSCVLCGHDLPDCSCHGARKECS